ncbi:hypothetical protein C8Q80DRAFT_1166504 [Daedaleopsis nitida]|nr:hypothetical protein C8Q80DRAFT_1166504 [Daedaleopsis nitida]
MSISTEDLGSYLCHSCSSDALKAGQIEGWKNELHENYHVFPGTFDQYLDIFVPSSAPETIPSLPLDKAFSTFILKKGKETRSYPGLLKGLRQVVAEFPPSKKVTFFPNHRAQILFPFKAFGHNHHATYPDIAISLPGEDLQSAELILSSMLLEVKSQSTDDPFERSNLEHSRTLVQLTVGARSLMVTHGLLSAFMIGIYGNMLRIVHYDHSGLVASPAFSVKRRPDLLQKFLWRFAHPVMGNTVVGCDPTTRKLTDAELAWVKARLASAGEDPLRQPEFCRRTEVYSTSNKDEVPRSFFLLTLVDINARLLSRSTTVWLAMEDPRQVLDGGLSALPDDLDEIRLVIIKDSWRQLVRRDEKVFYDRLEGTIPEAEWTGLPRVVCGGDLGEREVSLWKARGGSWEGLNTNDDKQAGPSSVPPQSVFPRPPADPVTPSRRAPPSTTSSPNAALSSLPSSPLTPLPSSDPPIAPTTPLQDTTRPCFSSPLTPLDKLQPQYPLRVPQQQTYTWRVLFGDAKRHRERSHMRLVIDTVGRRLTRFRSTRELILAMRDAMRAHKLAWEKGKLLHRDVSVGNILIVEKPESRPFSGFLHDFDYSNMESLASLAKAEASGTSDPGLQSPDEISNVDEELKERTGTYFFIACQLLDRKLIIHDARHDLESFFWVLIWVILRHTEHEHYRGDEACGLYFKLGDADVSRGAKMLLLHDAAHSDSIMIPEVRLNRSHMMRYLLCSMRH